MAETPLITRRSRSARRSAPRLVRVKTMHCLGRSRLSKQKQQVEFLIGVDRNVELLDRVDRWLILREVDLDRLEHVALSQLPDIRVDRGGQEQRLAWLGKLAENPLDIGTEADVQHPVGLIEHDVHDIAEIKRAAFDMVEHAAGRADHDVDSPRQ